MRVRLPVFIGSVLAVCTFGAIAAQQVTDPLPSIEKRGLAVEIRDVVRLPDTRGMRPADQDVTPAGWARVSYVRDLPDGRRFANDSRGFLYLLDRNNQPPVYANVGAAFPLAVYNRLESGFIGFVFHPEFARNGLFYTVHAERAPGNPATPNFIPPGFTAEGRDLPQRHHRVARDESRRRTRSRARGASCCASAHVVANLTHPMGAVEFNPTAKPGDAGLRPALHQRQRSSDSATAADRTRTIPARRSASTRSSTAILRIDPRSPSVTRRHEGPRRLHDSDGQQVRRGRRSEDARRDLRLRLPQRPPALVGLTDGTMFASDIGMNHIEEINIVRNGENYGWMKREGLLGERHAGAAARSTSCSRCPRRSWTGARRTASPIRSRSTTTTKGRR